MQTSDTESCEIIHDYRTSTTAGGGGGGNASGANSMDSRGGHHPHHHHHHHSHHSSSLTHGSPRFRNRNQQQQMSRLVGSKKSSNETSSNIEADEDLRLSNEAIYRGRGRDSDDMLDDDEEPDEVEEEEEEEEEESEVESEEEEDEVERQFRRKPRSSGIERRPSDAVTRNYISDELKYGAGHNRGTPVGIVLAGQGGDLSHHSHSHHNNSHSSHHNHQSLDSNPVESQSEWSDDECREEATGGAESTGYITDEPGLENISLLNEAGLTDAEGALSDVNSLYNAPDVDDTSISSRASSRLLSLDSLSGLYDCDLDSKHEMAIVSASHKISSKFGPATANSTTAAATNGSTG